MTRMASIETNTWVIFGEAGTSSSGTYTAEVAAPFIEPDPTSRTTRQSA